MGVFTRRQISTTPFRLHCPLSLEEIRDRAIVDRYPIDRDGPSAGWGSSLDDDEILGLPVEAGLTVGRPQIIDAGEGLDRRLRLRYYWDVLDSSAHRSVEPGARWQRFNTREAMDVVIFEEPGLTSHLVLASSRDRRLIKARPLHGLDRLISIDGGDNGRVEFDALHESLPHDFFAWLLYKLNTDTRSVGHDVRLEVIDEISSRDRNLRGARFTDRATLERIELAALITMGDHRFGPAKVALTIADLDARFELQLELDGGFKAYRTSEYDSRRLSEDEFGHALIEDIWGIVLPRLRSAHQRDTAWSESGRSELRAGAVALIRSILPDDAGAPARL